MGGDKDKVVTGSTVFNVALPQPSEHPADYEEKETFLSIGLQVFFPVILAGLAMVGAGIYLNRIETWEVFTRIPEIVILVPALLGLKGNLEMTLASRLSTEANLGKMSNRKEQWSMIFGNLALVQCQAVVIGLLSSLVAILMVGIIHQEFILSHSLMVCACSIMTASLASFVLGVLTSGIIVVSVNLKINPDNIATPIAASMGDIISLVLLSYVASYLYHIMGTHDWLSILFICLNFAIMPLWIWIAKNNKYTKSILTSGWCPIVVAMLISTFGGLALDKTMKSYSGLSAFQPVVNGVGGNLVSIQASRLSTALHKRTVLGQLPPECPIVIPPWKIFTSDSPHSLTSRVLLALVIPGHLIFAFVIMYLQTGDFSIGPLFLCFYMAAALLQVALLLYIAYILTHYFWQRGIDPDNSTIPYLTALGDLLGILLLGLTYTLVEMSGKIMSSDLPEN
ncbi:hypothetical protein AAG570_008046 [Ranatra chinensis]|uniref:SLC41A/MgtE integral membrane domain-containing protein n=1 Tax=Ranatra chinensis TaxID=642074 RepID=A0ABD0Y8W0_9HEMI